MRLLPAVLFAAAAVPLVFAQSYTIKTVAGGKLPENIPGAMASVGRVNGVATDIAGNVYIPLPDYHIVVRLDPMGNLTRVAGTGAPGSGGDNGSPLNAQLNGPSQVAMDPFGNLYIADAARVRKISGGYITTVAGGGSDAGENVVATTALLAGVGGIAADVAGNVYISETGNHRVRKVAAGMITTVAGKGQAGFAGDDGPLSAVRLSSPHGIAIDTAGNIYIADSGNNRIRKISSSTITTVAGTGDAGFAGDNGAATEARLYGPTGLALDSAGNLYIGDANNNRVRRISNGVISTVAGSGPSGFGGDGGPAAWAQLNAPLGVAVDASGNVFFADSQNYRVRKVAAGLITTVAGGGSALGDNGAALSSQLAGPWSVALDAAGAMYIADGNNHRIRKVAGGNITTVAGSGTPGFGGDNGPAGLAQLYRPGGVAVDAAGSIYIADTLNHRIRKVANGVIATVAGTGTAGYSGDNGPAVNAQLNAPLGILLDGAGNLYIADSGNLRVRKISNGVITTVAGGATFAGDSGIATAVQLGGPSALALDTAGSLYIADQDRIRKVANGSISTVAGGGTSDQGDGGAAVNANMPVIYGVGVDGAGNIYVSDTSHHRMRKVTRGIITTVAGSGVQGFAGDNGLATSAQLSEPHGIAVDGSGNVYFADWGNSRIRTLTPMGGACTFSVSATSLAFGGSGGNLSIGVQTDASCAWSVAGLPSWLMVVGAASGTGPATVTLVAPANPGAARSANITLAGQPIAVAQQGSGACTYTLSPAGQAWAASGGNGTINVIADAGCSWTAASVPNWVTIAGTPAGAGSGTLNYVVAANAGVARSGLITIAGQYFSIEQAAVSTVGMSSVGAMAHMASAGTWTTTITLVNTGTAPAQARLNFFDDGGVPLLLPLTFPQASTGGPTLGSTLDRTINPGATLVVETTGPDSQNVQVGWAQLLASGNVSGFAVFRQRSGGDQEAVVPLETRNAAAYVLRYDNAGGYATGVALANVAQTPAAIAVVIRDDTGAITANDTITLPAQGHTAFNLVDRYAFTAGQPGTLEFQTPAGGQISVLGLRFNPKGAFSTVPPLVK